MKAKTKSNTQPVRAWVDELALPTYPVPAPDPNPMFFETRNIQGASGKVYPNPLTDQLSSTKVERTYQVVYLENDYLQLIVMPELGGRIFAGLDKTNGYDFFYRHRVIKPQLIGTFGAWISGGVEFNWPQHHRPSTFMPVDFTLEEGEDGSQTVWLSEHDPLFRTKGMVGICLYPGKALLETKARLYNRTPVPQSFLWWENAGVHINEEYQVFFPPDVRSAVFHVKRPVVRFPIATGEFNSGMVFDNTDVRWYKNFPMPTSFFSTESKYDFFGGYDHRKGAGIIHVANRHISPGKKFFTWGNGPFGHQWQRNLTDYDDPYLELMAGVYTDNQPDFTWIAPYETKAFSQFWYPIQKIGIASNANRCAAVSLEVDGRTARIGVYAVAAYPKARITLSSGDRFWLDEKTHLEPGAPFCHQVGLPEDIPAHDLLLRVCSKDGHELIRYQPEKEEEPPLPEPYIAPPAPADAKTNEELYLVGLHLEQYKHPMWFPEPYWEEALRRDPEDARSHNALGLLSLKRGMFARAEDHFRKAIKRLTWRNFNPYDTESYYNLGLALRGLGRLEDAYGSFYKATWSYTWASASCYALAEIDCLRGNYAAALQHLDLALQTNSQHLKARDLKAAVLRKLGKPGQAGKLAVETLALDPLDHWARNERALALRQSGNSPKAKKELKTLRTLMRRDVQTYLDIAFDYANAGFWEEASDLLERLASPKKGKGTSYPMVFYALGFFAHKLDEIQKAAAWYRKGRAASPDYCFPARLEEMQVLHAALQANPEDARAHYYLGNLLYDKKQYAAAMQHWEASTSYEPSLAIPWRNLGLATYNRLHDLDKAIRYYRRAVAANSQDPRMFYELDQLEKRLSRPPEERLANFEAHREVIFQRGDLVVELAMLYNRLGQPEKALEIFQSSEFHLWEGGEGLVLEQTGTAHWLLGRQTLDAGDPRGALAHFERGLSLPDAWGESGMRRPLIYAAGLAYEAMGDAGNAMAAFEKAAQAVKWTSPAVYIQALALVKLSRENESAERLQVLLEYANKLAIEPYKPDYFHPQSPSVTFEDDPQTPQRIYAAYLTGLAHQGLGQVAEAKAAFEKVLALDPAHTGAWVELSRLNAQGAPVPE